MAGKKADDEAAAPELSYEAARDELAQVVRRWSPAGSAWTSR